MAEHARLGLSNTRWPKCAGSVREEAVYPDSTGEAAIDGTGSHLLLEMTAHLGKCNHMLDVTIGEGHEDRQQGWWVKQDRIDRVNECLAYIQRRIEELGGASVHTESRANPGAMFGREDWWGTTDLVLEGVVENVIEIIDYKDGRGYVSEKDNTQLIGNAIGVCHARKATALNNPTIRLTIVQPKTNPTVRYVEMTLEELSDKAAELSAAAALTDDANAPLKAGAWCTWCKHGRAGNCDAKNNEGMEGLQIMTQSTGQNDFIAAIQSGDLNLSEMPADQLAAIAGVASSVKKLITMVDDEMFKRIDADPDSIPGYAMGRGNGSRVWNNEEDVVAAKLKGMRVKKGDIYPAKLITPAQAEKLECLNAKQLAKLPDMITSIGGKKKVVKAAAKKIEKSVEDMFGALPEKPLTFADAGVPQGEVHIPGEAQKPMSFL